MAKQLIECAYCKGRGTYTYLKKGVKGAFREEPAYEAKCPVLPRFYNPARVNL